MQNLQMLLMLGLVALVVQSCVTVDDDRVVACGGAHRLRIVDLDMSPDPIAQGQRVGLWRVRLRADASGECRTAIVIREEGSNEVVGQDRVFRLRPGNNEITFEPNSRYRFSRNEHCFTVVANVAGTPRRVDASRRFCARETGGRRWTMR